MSSAAVFVLVLGGLAYAAYAVPTLLQFFAYCDQVALATGRTKESTCLKSQDDGGINAFQQEQYRMLRSGEFMNFTDASVVARGTVVARKLKVSFWGALVLVLSVAAANLWAR